MTLFLMIILNPEVQKEARAEINKMIGSEHLHVLEDRPDLPYIECILKEVLRYVLSDLNACSL